MNPARRSRLLLYSPAVAFIALLLAALFAAPNRNQPSEIALPTDAAALLLLPNNAGLLVGRADGVLERRSGTFSTVEATVTLGSSRLLQLTATTLPQTPPQQVAAVVVQGESLVLLESSSLRTNRELAVPGILRGGISPAGTWLAAGTDQGEVWLRTVTGTDWQVLQPPHRKLVTALAWSPSSKLLATGSQAGTIFVWDVTTGQQVLSAAEPHSTIMQVGFDATEKSVVVVHFDQTMTVFDLATGTRTAQLVQNAHTRCATFAANGEALVTVGRRGRVTLRTGLGVERNVLRYQGPPCTNGSIEGELLVLAGAGNRLCVWDLAHVQPPCCTPLICGLYLISLALTLASTLHDWRVGLMYCIALDALRDPVRKMLPESPVWVTLVVALPWAFVLLSALQPLLFVRVQSSLSRHWKLLERGRVESWALAAGILLLVASTVRTMTLHSAGWKLALMGWTAYLSPFMGLVIGMQFLQSTRDLKRLSVVIVLVNAVLVTTALFELWGWDWRGLGGVEFDWIRYRRTGLISLMSGFYRSPDLLGMHAASVVIYSLLLVQLSLGRERTGWLCMTGIGAVGLLICGRRKMLLVVALFLLTGLLTMLRSTVRWSSRTVVAGLTGIALLAVLVVGVLPNMQGIMPDYLRYALSLGREGFQRSWGLMDSVRVTLHQSGTWGLGIGTATQGSYRYRSTGAPMTWQEDGLSRIAAELGVPGLLLFAVACGLIVRELFHCVRRTPQPQQLTMVLLCGMVLGHLGCYLAAHMSFTGDVSTSILGALPLGLLVGYARLASPQPLEKLPGSTGTALDEVGPYGP